MEFRLLPDALEVQESERWVKIGGHIKVLARTRSSDQKRSYGVLLEWKNLDGVHLQDIVLIRHLQGDNSRLVREMLIDSGYQLEPSPQAWQRLQRYLLNELQRAEPATCVERTGWHAEGFVSPGWIAPRGNAKVHLLRKGLDVELRSSGTLEQWQEEIGKVCIGNPLLIFCCGVALSAPLLSSSGVENVIFHLYGDSGSGKSTAMKVATSVLGDESLMRTWLSTANGLAAAAALHHDVPLFLDELSQAKPEDADVAVYSICNGRPKLRSNETGQLAIGESWRTIALSNGEVTLAEHLAQLGKEPLAGQLSRVIEIPITGQYGVFDTLHGFKRGDLLSDELKRRCKNYYGTLFPAWVDRLVSYEEAELARKVTGLLNYHSELMKEDAEVTLDYSVSPQVMRVIRHFAIVQVALIMANHFNLLPWLEHHSVNAINHCFSLWLKNRGHGLDTEDYRLFCMLKAAIQGWGPYIRPLEGRLKSSVGYSRTYQGEPQWLVKTDVLKQALNLRPQYRSQMLRLVKRDWLQFNEEERLTLKVVQEKKSARFFAIWPERIKKALAELEVD
jgi:putative DNA primase/helicase